MLSKEPQRPAKGSKPPKPKSSRRADFFEEPKSRSVTMEASSFDSDELEDSYLDCTSSEDSIVDANKEKKRKPDQVFVKIAKRSQDPGVPAAGIRIVPKKEEKEAESQKQPAANMFTNPGLFQKGSAPATLFSNVPNMFMMEKPAEISKAAQPPSQSHVYIFGQTLTTATGSNGQAASDQGVAKPMQNSIFRAPEPAPRLDFAQAMFTDEQEQRQNIFAPPNILSVFSVPKKQEMELFSKNYMETNPFLTGNCFAPRLQPQQPPPPQPPVPFNPFSTKCPMSQYTRPVENMFQSATFQNGNPFSQSGQPQPFTNIFNNPAQPQPEPNIFRQFLQQRANIFTSRVEPSSSTAAKAPNMFQSQVSIPNLFAPPQHQANHTSSNPFINTEQPSFFKISQPNNLFSTAPPPPEKAEVKCPPLKPEAQGLFGGPTYCGNCQHITVPIEKYRDLLKSKEHTNELEDKIKQLEEANKKLWRNEYDTKTALNKLRKEHEDFVAQMNEELRQHRLTKSRSSSPEENGSKGYVVKVRENYTTQENYSHKDIYTIIMNSSVNSKIELLQELHPKILEKMRTLGTRACNVQFDEVEKVNGELQVTITTKYTTENTSMFPKHSYCITSLRNNLKLNGNKKGYALWRTPTIDMKFDLEIGSFDRPLNLSRINSNEAVVIMWLENDVSPMEAKRYCASMGARFQYLRKHSSTHQELKMIFKNDSTPQ